VPPDIPRARGNDRTGTPSRSNPMRPDMAKLIVERPRKGGGCKFPRARDRALIDNAAWEDAPTREPHKSRFHDRPKYFNENLAPLRRFLRTNLGKPWALVHPEIAAQVPRNSTINYHVWQHLQWDVAEDVHLVDGTPYRLGRSFSGWPYCGFYVDPSDGTLREARPPSNRERSLRCTLNKCTRPDILRVSDELEYHRINGIWYAVTFAQIPPGAAFVWDVLKREVVYLVHELRDDDKQSRTGRYPARKRQLSKREIRRTIAPRLRQLAGQRQHAANELARLDRARQSPGSFIFARPYTLNPKNPTLQTTYPDPS
jgi:hypothetical protein